MTTVYEKTNRVAPGDQGHCCKSESDLIDLKACQRGKKVKGSRWKLPGN